MCPQYPLVLLPWYIHILSPQVWHMALTLSGDYNAQNYASIISRYTYILATTYHFAYNFPNVAN